MRLIAAACLIAYVAGAIAFSWLNAGATTVDFYFAHWSAPLGVVLIAALAIGWLLGGITAWFGNVRRQRSERKSSVPIGSVVAPAPPDPRETPQ